jgi:hypothetical protein
MKIWHALMRLAGVCYGIYGVWAFGAKSPAEATYYLAFAIWIAQNTGDAD